MTNKHGERVKEAIDFVKNFVEKNTKTEGDANQARVRRIDEEYEPLTVKDNNVIVAADWHGPFHDRKLERCVYKAAEDYGVKTILIPGDFFDCDNYTKFLKLTYIETFQQEVGHVSQILNRLGENFKQIYFCRGNHERRWLEQNKGLMNIKNLFAILQTKANYKVTADDYIRLFSGDEEWRLSHQKEFSKNQLSVAVALADKYHVNMLSAHGHQFGQGYDTSGDFKAVDGGGIFDVQQIEYLRNTTRYPSVHSGFYVIQDGDPIPFPGKNVKGRYR